MRSTLQYVDPTRPPGILVRPVAVLAATRVARSISRHISWKFDPWLLQASGGRLATTLVVPTAILATTGGKTSAPRRNAVISFHDGVLVILAASNPVACGIRSGTTTPAPNRTSRWGHSHVTCSPKTVNPKWENQPTRSAPRNWI